MSRHGSTLFAAITGTYMTFDNWKYFTEEKFIQDLVRKDNFPVYNARDIKLFGAGVQ